MSKREVEPEKRRENIYRKRKAIHFREQRYYERLVYPQGAPVLLLQWCKEAEHKDRENPNTKKCCSPVAVSIPCK